MCNCFKEISEKIKSTVTFKHPILSVTAPQAFALNSATNEVILTHILPFSVKLEGQKKDKTINVEINFCPICGEKCPKSN